RQPVRRGRRGDTVAHLDGSDSERTKDHVSKYPRLELYLAFRRRGREDLHGAVYGFDRHSKLVKVGRCARATRHRGLRGDEPPGSRAEPVLPRRYAGATLTKAAKPCSEFR